MRLTHIALRGIGPYRDEARVALDEIAGRLVAVVGPNGSGKSTLLETGVLGAIDRSTPTRGALTELATGRDGMVELGLDVGRPLTIRQLVDGVGRKGEALVLDGDGAPLLPDAKVTTFDRWRAENLPPTAVLLSTVFAAQSSGGFLDLSPGDRKAVLLRALGIEHLEALAEDARERARGAKARLDALAARIADEEARGVSVLDATVALVDAQNAREAADADVETAREALRLARERHAELVAAFEDAEKARRARQEAAQREATAKGEYDTLRRRCDVQKVVLADAGAVRDAERLLPDARDAAEKAAAEASRLREIVAAVRQDVAAAGKAAAQASSDYAAARKRADEGTKAARDLDAARNAAGAVPALREKVNATHREAERITDAIDALRSATLDVAGKRITVLRCGLSVVVDAASDTGARIVAADTLIADDHLAREAAEAPEKDRELAAASRKATDELMKATEALAEAERVAARLPDLERAAAAAGDAAHEAREAEGRREIAEKEQHAARLRLDLASGHLRDAEAAVSRAQSEVSRLAPIAARAGEIAAAEARLDELRDATARALAAWDDAKRVLDATPEPPAALPVPDVAAEERAVAEAERRARDAHGAVAVAEKGVADAQERAKRIAALESEQHDVEEALSDWTRLGRDLGRDGVQAYEIDAAGPEISTIATSLLHECFGPRWTVSLATTRPSADGKKSIECFEVRVLDTESGRDGEATGLSGGERVIVGEALSLALTTVACRRAGFERPTLIRDESGAALDAERARAYVAMLRRAADLIGADKVLLVSHSPEVQMLCDSRISIADGRVEVAA